LSSSFSNVVVESRNRPRPRVDTPPVSPDDRLPFQRLDVYLSARQLAKAIHDAGIRDPELRDQATRASKSTFCNLCEGLPSRSTAVRRRYFAIADGSLHEAVGAVDLAAAIGAVDAEPAEAIQALGARTLRLLRGLTR
jgi:four helix bundle protein